MKSKLRILHLFLVIAFIIYCIGNEIKDSKKTKTNIENVDELRTQIKEIKATISKEKLSKCSIEMDTIFMDKKNLQLDKLAYAFRVAKIGGVSHPMNKCFFIFRDNSSVPQIMIKVYISENKSSNQTYGTIDICENGVPIYGIPFISDEMTEWAYSVGLYD